MRHTAAPWRFDKYGIRDRGGYICELHWPSRYDGQEDRFKQEMAEREGDARLIAAAPDLLAALNACVAVAKSWHNMGVEDGSPLDVWQIYYDNAPEMKPIRDAIAKATP